VFGLRVESVRIVRGRLDEPRGDGYLSMKWIRTRNGDRAHAVSSRDTSITLCGIAIQNAVAIVTPGPSDRCENCDHEWRKGAKTMRPKKKRKKDVYSPRLTFSDWDKR
jgi:hypothetical protein